MFLFFNSVCDPGAVLNIWLESLAWKILKPFRVALYEEWALFTGSECHLHRFCSVRFSISLAISECDKDFPVVVRMLLCDCYELQV